MAETTAALTRTVQPLMDGDWVLCGKCGQIMNPYLWKSVEGAERSLFWRCAEDPDHVTRGMPLGHLRICL